MKTYTIVNGDDWAGLYVDGKLVVEGHSLDPYRVAKEVALAPGYVTSLWVDLDWLHDRGDLPRDLADVKIEE